MTSSTSLLSAGLSDHSSKLETIPVHVSYEIIRLFSEGLYQSPHKAVEELVSNGYDAGASRVHVLLPEQPDADEAVTSPLWVIDNGHGMDVKGFRQLWRVADSKKATVGEEESTRPPIGQFGIGKLAAYVLAWRLLHISKVGQQILLTEMNFRDVTGRHQFEDTDPVQLSLLRVDEDEARGVLEDVEHRDPEAWEFMFGASSAQSWTAAALSDFKNLYDRLSTGRLRWVLSTGLPLLSDFGVWLNGEKLESSKERYSTIVEITTGAPTDGAAKSLALESHPGGGVLIPGIEGAVRGTARIYEQRLTQGKSDQYGRSHGFFVRVRGRVINLEDELFGLDALNHAAWSRFAMEVDADGLREYLLSSREGVRESEPTRTLRRYLHHVFNICRKAYDEWSTRQLTGLDIENLLSDAPSLFVTDPLLQGVREALETGSESFYVARPDLGPEVEPSEWLGEYAKEIAAAPFREVLFEATGPRDRALHYVPETRTLIVNTEHPFVDKLISSGRNRGSATLFGSSEVMMDVLLRDHGIPSSCIRNPHQSLLVL